MLIPELIQTNKLRTIRKKLCCGFIIPYTNTRLLKKPKHISVTLSCINSVVLIYGTMLLFVDVVVALLGLTVNNMYKPHEWIITVTTENKIRIISIDKGNVGK